MKSWRKGSEAGKEKKRMPGRFMPTCLLGIRKKLCTGMTWIRWMDIVMKGWWTGGRD